MNEKRQETAFSGMTESELSTWLAYYTFSDEQIDPAVIDAIVRELDKRGEPGKNSQKPQGRTIKLTRFALAAAAALAVMLAATVASYALGFDLWGPVATWSRDTFSFAYDSADGGADGGLNMSLRECLDALDMASAEIPALPEDFALTEINTSLSGGRTSVEASYSAPGGDVAFLAAKGGRSYAKNDVIPEEYLCGGTTYYIMTYLGRYQAIWADGDYEYRLSGFREKAVLVSVLDSLSPALE